ncbi:MAG TPA: hypothetical protein VMF13_01490 [Luteitalea sp.]|nr:hypothetical protein [Luteitalea sp.]
MLRRLNTAQANRQAGTFLSLAGLRDHELMAPYRERATPHGDHEWTIAGHRLRLLVSPERTHYTATLHPEGVACGKAWFTSESGVILSGQALGC